MPPRRAYTAPIPNRFAHTAYDRGSITSSEEAFSSSNTISNNMRLEITKHKISMRYQAEKEDKDRDYMKEKDDKDREYWREKDDKFQEFLKEDRDLWKEKENKDREFWKEKEININNRWNTFLAWLKEIIIIISPTINLFFYRALLFVYACCLMICFFTHKNVDMTKFNEVLPY
ncbi:6360_t:CDS:2, partial [Dentiscutata heterogama]